MGYKLKIVIAVIVVIIIAAIIAIYAVVSSRSRKDENVVIEREIKIFMSAVGGFVGDDRNYFIEYIYPNIFRFTSFESSTIRQQSERTGLDITRFEEYLSRPLPMDIIFPLSERTIYVRSHEWEVILSQEEINSIYNLVENVARRRVDREFEVYETTGRVPYIFAIIDGNMYWTIYVPNRIDIPMTRRERRYINENLSPLIHALIDLSPYPIQGWETPSSMGS